MKNESNFQKNSVSLGCMKRSLHEIQKARIRLTFCAMPINDNERSIYRDACNNIIVCENEIKDAITNYPAMTEVRE
jgi:hypothetical protein